MSEREEFIRGLRDFADLLESKGELPFPTYETMYVFMDSIDSVPVVAKAMAPCNKVYSDTSFTLVKEYNKHLVVKVVWSRDVVCKRVQVGVKEIPAQVIPAHTEPVYEWDCGRKSVLKDAQNQLEENSGL